MKKVLILLSVLMFFQIGFSYINSEELDKRREELLNSNITVEDAYEKLINVGSIGYDFNDVYLNVLLKEKNAEELLERVFKDSKSNAGKIFALQGMYKINNGKYQNMKKKLHGKVVLFHGCYFTEENAKKYLNRMEVDLKSWTEGRQNWRKFWGGLWKNYCYYYL